MLPKISHPTFSLILPSTKQEVIFRPFLVKEEKILLISQQAQDPAETIRSIKQVVQNCILSDGIFVNDFATFDLEYFFIKLRSKSVNNVVKLSFKDNDDNKIYDFEVDLEEIKLVNQNSNYDTEIVIDQDTNLKLRYPKIDLMEQMKSIENPNDFAFLLLKHCMYEINHKNQIFKTSEYSAEQIDDFVNNLDLKTYQKIQDFFESIPRLEYVINYTNSNNKEVKIVLNNLNDFFTLG